MFTHFLVLPDWQLYIVPATGIVCAVVALSLGHAIVRRTQRNTPEILSVSGWMRRMCPDQTVRPGFKEQVEEWLK
ncbi:MAG TPA: hypothetical protein VK395_20255 [Gemmataceae bacterium]|nr:hypothetical protein [Gemmataceae bacterium]